jgi:glycosyltransferase involved in cell wall biosynthesis
MDRAIKGRTVIKVAFVTRAATWSGAEVHTLELASVMARRGHLVTIVQSGGELYGKRVLDRRLPLGVRSLPMRYSGLRSLNADIGVLIKGDFGTGGAIGDAAQRLAFPRFLTIEHSPQAPLPPRPKIEASGLKPRLGIWWYRAAFRRKARALWPDLTICVSDAVKAGLMHHSGFPANRLATVHNGVETSRFRRDESARRDWRARWGIGPDALVFGAVGRMSPTKNLEVAVKGFAELAAREQKDAWLVLVGEGPEQAALEALARSSGVGERVLFPGSIEDTAAVYSALDVFVMPSVSEGLPFALLEAMSSECAPIANAVGGIPEVIAGPDMGWLVPNGRSDRFAEAMRSAALSSGARLRAVGAAARTRVDTHFNAAVQYGTLADLLERHAGLPAGPGNREEL